MSTPPDYRVLFQTHRGKAVVGDSFVVLDCMEPESVDLVITSPPFALLREKEYGNLNQSNYVDWLCQFGPKVRRVLKNTGSYVLDLGGAYQRGLPIRSLYPFRVLLRHVDELGFFLAQEFFWHNPSKLPSPIEWVNKRKLRAKDSVDTIWWLSKTDAPKADVSKVLVPYSTRMKALLKNPSKFYQPKNRPSGHDISEAFARDNGGAIPSNMLQFANSESNGSYLRLRKAHGLKPHPARFPRALPEFFIRFLTEPEDLVVDIFGGSGTTGEAAEALGRNWLTIDINEEYVRTSAFRFARDESEMTVSALLGRIGSTEPTLIEAAQPMLF